MDEDVEYTPADWQIRRVKMREESQPRDRALSAEETQRLVDAAQESSWPMLPLALKTAISTGARRTEIATMRWENISLDERTVTFPTTKNVKPRTIPLIREICEALHPWPSSKATCFVVQERRTSPSRSKPSGKMSLNGQS